jgi:hypothetical protein
MRRRVSAVTSGDVCFARVVPLRSVTAPALTGERNIPMAKGERKRKTLWISRLLP